MDEQAIIIHSEETLLRLVATEAAAIMALPDEHRKTGALKLRRLADELRQFADELLA